MAGEVRKDPVREFECGGGGGGGEAPEGRARGAAAADGGAYAGDSRASPPPQPSRSPLAAFLAAEDSVGSDGSSRVLPELVQRTLPPPQTGASRRQCQPECKKGELLDERDGE